MAVASGRPRPIKFEMTASSEAFLEAVREERRGN